MCFSALLKRDVKVLNDQTKSGSRSAKETHMPLD